MHRIVLLLSTSASVSAGDHKSGLSTTGGAESSFSSDECGKYRCGVRYTMVYLGIQLYEIVQASFSRTRLRGKKDGNQIVTGAV